LLAGEYDIAEFTDPQTSEALQDNKNYTLKYFTSDGNFLYFRACITRAPFDDKRVREALKYAVDREALNQTLFGGRGEPMTGLWPKSSPFHNEALDSLHVYNPAKAKALLTEAGHPNGISFDVVYAADQKAQQRLNEIFQGSAAKAGMTVQLVPSNNIIQDAFVNPRAPVIGVNNQRPGLSKITRPFGAGSISNMCNYRSDDLDKTAGQIAALSSDDPNIIPLWKRADQIIADDAVMSYAVFQAWVMAWNSSKVSGVDLIYGPYMGPEFQTIRVR
jgi:peptide/nickel transport system substrate-binding protein